MKKLVVSIIALICLFSFFLFFYFHAHNYTSTYEVNGVSVTEEYIKEDTIYRFKLNYNGKEYELIDSAKYSPKRHLIEDINIIENNNDICLTFKTNKVSLYPICSNDETYYSYYAYQDTTFTELSSLDNIKIGNIKDTYLVWNYHSFSYISPKKQTTIDLFSNDVYNLNLIYQYKNYLLIPDYDNDYKYTKLYIINSNNAKVDKINLRYEVYFDSYFLGSYKDKVYLFDRKNEQTYYIDLKKDEIYKTSPKLLINGEWEKTTIQKLKNNKLTFSNIELFTYTLKDNRLVAKAMDSNMEFLVTDKKVSSIVSYNLYDIYYISKDTLYHYNLKTGEEAVLQNSEWNFNNSNMIYVF